MTKWVCNNKRCGGTDPCRVELAPWFAPPENCLYSAGSACWKRDCTTEEKKDDLKITDKNILDVLQSMNRRIANSDKKVQDLITAGQGQMARIQALEKEVARSTDSYLQKQIDALDKKIDDLEGKYRAHSHIYGTHQWDQYTSQPRYMG